MKTNRIILTAVLGLAAFGASSFAGADEARIKALRQSIDDFDAKIKQVVRDLSTATDPNAIQELNRQLKQYVGERSTAIYDLWKAEDEAREKEKLQNEVAAFLRARGAFVTDRNAFEKEADAHNEDAKAQHAAIHNFDSLPDCQRTQAELDRLNEWGRRIDARKAGLEPWRARLDSRRIELLSWSNAFNARGAGIP